MLGLRLITNEKLKYLPYKLHFHEKIFYAGLSAAMLCSLASCSSEDDLGLNAGPGNVNFTIELPADIATRAYSDGLTANNLHVYVYDEDAENPVYLDAMEQNITLQNRTANVSLNLASGKKYSIIFWADAPGNGVYTVDKSNKVLTVSYDAAVSQQENRDAFYYYEEPFDVSGPITKSVKLKRPLAQINVGTSDMVAFQTANGSVSKCGMKVEGVANKLHFDTGEVEGNETVTFSQAAFPATLSQDADKNYSYVGEQFPYQPEKYMYMGMNYVLVGKDKSTVDLTVETDNAHQPVMQFFQVPVQRNYRTNIFGTLLTNPANYNVTVDQPYGDGDFNLDFSKWDGTTKTEITPKEMNGKQVYDINNAAEFAWMADQDDALGKNTTVIDLNVNVDLDGHPFDGFGDATSGSLFKYMVSGKPLKATFNGNGHTVSNININYSGNGFAGFVSGIAGGSLNNIILENLKVTSTTAAATGGAVGKMHDGTIENVIVRSGSVSGAGYVAGICGNFTKGTIKGCQNAAAITGTGNYTGGIAGASYYGSAGYKEITNCSNTGEVNGNYAVGGISGYNQVCNLTGCSNSGNVTGNTSGVGGIVGENQTAAVITGCTNSGNVTAGLYAGGIVGWVCYNDGSSKHAVVDIESCTNTGTVKGEKAGGIAGDVYCAITVNGCTNSAPAITARSANAAAAFVATGYKESNSFNKIKVNKYTITGNTNTTPWANITAAGTAVAEGTWINTSETDAVVTTPENH